MKNTKSITCPGLFYATSALDGNIYRIRTPGGIIQSYQGRVIAELNEKLGNGYIQITNRANLQIRAISDSIPVAILNPLQEIGLAARNSEVDHLRNVMSSPTAGIDRQQLIDTRPLVKQLNDYISSHPHLAELPAKFSVGFDGGEGISIYHQPNEILLKAVQENNKVYFRLSLSFEKNKPPLDTGILLQVNECLPVVMGIMEIYLEQVRHSPKKLRLRDILQQWGIDWFIDRLAHDVSFPLIKSSNLVSKNSPSNYPHLGIYSQLQDNLSYVGIVIPLGCLYTKQLRELANLTEIYSQGIFRLTPWQNILIPDVPDSKIHDLQAEIENLGLSIESKQISSGLVACTGNIGCAVSATDTRNHALNLAKSLDEKLLLNNPISIHFTGCPKSCAQQTQSDITLLGTTIQKGEQTIEGYHLYIASEQGGEKFGQLLYRDVQSDEIPTLIEGIIQKLNDELSIHS